MKNIYNFFLLFSNFIITYQNSISLAISEGISMKNRAINAHMDKKRNDSMKWANTRKCIFEKLK